MINGFFPFLFSHYPPNDKSKIEFTSMGSNMF